jgi:hypothetical protein
MREQWLGAIKMKHILIIQKMKASTDVVKKIEKQEENQNTEG